MMGPTAQPRQDGRLHLQHGPIDLLIDADGPDRQEAFGAATWRFRTVLQELVDELPLLRSQVSASSPRGVVARRMHCATQRHAADGFVTPMAAVAGSAADEILKAMTDATPLTRAYVNNGGDIALHLRGRAMFSIAMRGADNADLGGVRISARDGVGGVATSGRAGRSLSLGIADSVTVLAADAASADVAATLIANAVDLPGHPAIRRCPAIDLDPDSDLGERLVVIGLGNLSRGEVVGALDAGLRRAEDMRRNGQIHAAALSLLGTQRLTEFPAGLKQNRELTDA